MKSISEETFICWLLHSILFLNSVALFLKFHDHNEYKWKTQTPRIENMQVCACVFVASHCRADSFLADMFEMLHPDFAVVLAAVWEQFDAWLECKSRTLLFLYRKQSHKQTMEMLLRLE